MSMGPGGDRECARDGMGTPIRDKYGTCLQPIVSQEKWVFISAPDPDGVKPIGWFCVGPYWDNRRGRTMDMKCTYDFATGTYIDHEGTRWDPRQWNKRVE